MQSTLNVRLVWLDKVENLSGLLLILGLTNLGTLLGEKGTKSLIRLR
jgi:hypothetical protein